MPPPDVPRDEREREKETTFALLQNSKADLRRLAKHRVSRLIRMLLSVMLFCVSCRATGPLKSVLIRINEMVQNAAPNPAVRR